MLYNLNKNILLKFIKSEGPALPDPYGRAGPNP